MFDENRKAVDDTNRNMLTQIYTIALIICLVLFIVCMVAESFQRLLPVYMLYAFLFTLVYFGLHELRHGGIMGLYIFSALLIGGCIYLSAGVSPDSIGGSILGMFILIPVVLFDRAWRVAAFMTVAYGINTAFSMAMKVPDLALTDAVNGACFFIIGILMGRYLQRVKLSDINSQRLLSMQKNIDCLTGLYTRYRMTDILKSPRGCEVQGVVMMDIDWFKHYNDQYGHLEGDFCLKRIGACFKAFGKSHGLTFIRYGGEEFLMFTPYGDFERMWGLVQSLKEAVEALQIPFEGTPSGFVTISAGYSVRSSESPDIEQLINQADKALYKAKCQGRNCVVGY